MSAPDQGPSLSRDEDWDQPFSHEWLELTNRHPEAAPLDTLGNDDHLTTLALLMPDGTHRILHECHPDADALRDNLNTVQAGAVDADRTSSSDDGGDKTLLDAEETAPPARPPEPGKPSRISDPYSDTLPMAGEGIGSPTLSVVPADPLAETVPSHETESGPATITRSDPPGTRISTSRPEDSSTGISRAQTRSITHTLGHDDQRPLRLINRLGRGGMGEVLLAMQSSLGRPVAVKVLRGDRSTRHLRTAFGAETRLTASLEHPGVVPVHDAGLDYMVMKRVEGQTYEDLIRHTRDDIRELPRLIEILVQVCDTLAYAHRHHIIHRDLKPANIMVGEFGEVFLMDWGLAVALRRPSYGAPKAPLLADLPTACAGTPAYMPPEFARNRRDLIGPHSDLFMIAGILYRILTGHPPFTGSKVEEVIARSATLAYDPLAQAAPDAPIELTQAVERALAHDPPARGTLADFQAGLKSWLEHSGTQAEARSLARKGTERLIAAEQCRDRADAYRHLAAAVNRLDRALGLWPDAPDIQAQQARAIDAYARRALQVGDLVLAQSVLGHSDSPRLDTIRNDLRQVIDEQTRAARRQRRLRRSVPVLLMLLGLTGVAFLGYLAMETYLQGRARYHQAESLIAANRRIEQADPADLDRATLQLALARAHQAMGLAGDDTFTDHLRDVALTYARWAVAHAAPALARSQLRTALEAGLDQTTARTLIGDRHTAGTITWLETAEERRRSALRQQRQARLDEILTLAADLDHPAWLDQTATELAQWTWTADDTAGEALTRRALAALISHPAPTGRRFGIRLLSQHPQLRDQAGPLLLSLLDASSDAVFLDAARALIKLRPDHAALATTRMIMDRLPHIPLREIKARVPLHQLAEWAGPALKQLEDHLIATANTQRDGWDRQAHELFHIYRTLGNDSGALRIAEAADLEELKSLILHVQTETYADNINANLAHLQRLARSSTDGDTKTRAYMLASILLIQLDRPFEALDWIAEAEEHCPRSLHINILPFKAEILHTLDRPQLARNALERALDAFHNGATLNHRSCHQLCSQLARAGQINAALEIVRSYKEDYPYDWWTQLTEAKALFNAGRYEECIETTNLILERWPHFHFAYGHQALALLELGRLEEAEQVICKGMRFLGRYPTLLNIHGHILLQKNNYEHALHRFRAAMAMRPDSTVSKLNAFIAADYLGSLGDTIENGHWLIEHNYRLTNYILDRYLPTVLATGQPHLLIDHLDDMHRLSHSDIQRIFDYLLFYTSEPDHHIDLFLPRSYPIKLLTHDILALLCRSDANTPEWTQRVRTHLSLLGNYCPVSVDVIYFINGVEELLEHNYQEACRQFSAYLARDNGIWEDYHHHFNNAFLSAILRDIDRNQTGDRWPIVPCTPGTIAARSADHILLPLGLTPEHLATLQAAVHGHLTAIASMNGAEQSSPHAIGYTLDRSPITLDGLLDHIRPMDPDQSLTFEKLIEILPQQRGLWDFPPQVYLDHRGRTK